MCRWGLGWYPYFRMHARVFQINEFPAEQIKQLNKTKTDNTALPTEEYALLVKEFLKKYKDFGYSKSPCNVAGYTLHNLLLFMEMNGYRYHKMVASIWLEHEKLFHKSFGWKSSRRVFRLFDIYLNP